MRELGPGMVVAGRYTLRAQLGSGGFGTVWRATDENEGGAEVALKLLHGHLREDPGVVRRFVSEARLLSRLEHPGIARVVAWALASDHAAIALELVAGRSLDRELSARASEGRRVELAEAASIVSQLAAALAYAHEGGVVHRDLKPSNVMIDEVGAVKVLDFGVAKILFAPGTDGTTAGRVLGTLFYLAPEQARGAAIDLRADVFALGAIAFELLTLRRAWARDWEDRPLPVNEVLDRPMNHSGAVIQRIVAGLRPKATAWRPDVPEAVDAVLARAMAIDPADRYEDAPAFARDLAAALRGDAVRAVAREVVPPTAAAMASYGDTVVDPRHTTPDAVEVTAPGADAVAPRAGQVAPPAPAPPRAPAPWLLGAGAVLLLFAGVAVGRALVPPRAAPVPAPPEVLGDAPHATRVVKETPAAETAPADGLRGVAGTAGSGMEAAPGGSRASGAGGPRGGGAQGGLRGPEGGERRAASSAGRSQAMGRARAQPAPSARAPAPEPQVDPYAGLRRMVRELEANPGDAALLAELVERISAEARKLPEPRRSAVEGDVRRATFGGGAKALARALATLSEAP